MEKHGHEYTISLYLDGEQVDEENFDNFSDADYRFDELISVSRRKNTYDYLELKEIYWEYNRHFEQVEYYPEILSTWNADDEREEY